MALIKCIDCGKEVSDRAAACPNCGCPVEVSIAAAEKTKADTAEIASEEKTESEQIFENSAATKERKVLSGTRVGVVVAVVLIILMCIAVFGIYRSKKAPAETDGNVAAAQTAFVTSEAAEKSTTKAAKGELSFETYSQYDADKKERQVFLGFTDSNGLKAVKDGRATVKVINSNGDTVYSKDVSFDEKDFSDFTSSLWDGKKLLYRIVISDSDIKAGSASKGVISVSAEADGVSFSEDNKIDVEKLPVKETPSLQEHTAVYTTTRHYHDYESYVESEADCLNEGLIVYTCDCGDTYNERTPRTSVHEIPFGTPDCENDAICLVCNKVVEQSTGHDYDSNGVCYYCGAEDPDKAPSADDFYLELPSFPQTVASGTSSTVTVTDITYYFEPAYGGRDGTFWLKMYFNGYKKYDYLGENNNTTCFVDWKLYDSNGIVCTSGSMMTPDIATGDYFYELDTSPEPLTPGYYRLEIIY